MPTMVRYRLSDVGNETLVRKKGQPVLKAKKIISISEKPAGDLPTINPRYKMREARYITTKFEEKFFLENQQSNYSIA